MVITVIFMCLLGGVSLTGLILKLTGHDPLDIGGIISFGAQFEREHRRIITFYPAAVEDLRPIE